MEISKEELTRLKFFSLTNYRQIKTPFAFVDESGVLNDKSNPFFLIGLIKSHRPQTLYPLFRSIRDKHQYFAELKFNKLGMQNIDVAKAMMDVLFESKMTRYSSILIAKHDKEFDAVSYFNNNLVEIYRKFFVVLLKQNIGDVDLLTVLTDDYFFPYNKGNKSLETVEGSIRALINDHFQRLALSGVCQLNSCLNDFIQLTDLISGCVILDLKFAKGHLDKSNLSSTKKIQLGLLNHIKGKLNMGTEDSFFLEQKTFRKQFHRKNFVIRFFDPAESKHKKSRPSS